MMNSTCAMCLDDYENEELTCRMVCPECARTEEQNNND